MREIVSYGLRLVIEREWLVNSDPWRNRVTEIMQGTRCPAARVTLDTWRPCHVDPVNSRNRSSMALT